MNRTITIEEILDMERFQRLHLINTIVGYKNLNLIGTIGHRKVTNLGLFNSFVHVGANPPHLGFMIRQLTVPRHTYHNIKANKYFTVNHIHEKILAKAHQSSANYPENISEFAATGLTEEYTDRHPAPYVKESRVKIGCEYAEEHHMKLNGMIFLVGKIVEIILPEDGIDESGHLKLPELGTLACTGLDTYFEGKQIERLPYARVKQ
jgi:flavin reductase (DIM6/NTAB) family NADH-FMN oxidoreductase RutF